VRLSQLFTKTSKNVPADEAARNAQLLIQAGYIYKVMAGVYAYTPLGLKVLENIKQIVREEMNAVRGQELSMTNLQRPEPWQTTGRWDDKVVDVWFKTRLKDESEIGLAWSHEEAIIDMMKHFVSSYKDLPISVYQFQVKLRNELRAKSGIMRGREFVMKDMYSLNADAAQHDAYYDSVIEAYKKIYDRLGLGDDTYVTLASGSAFTEFSHEFQTICDAGEDTIFKVANPDLIFNQEITPAKAPSAASEEEMKPMEEVKGEGMIGVEELAKFLHIPVEKTTKTMLFQDETGRIIAAAVRGGYDVNEHKLRKILNVKELQLADKATVKRITHAEVGYAGLINLPAEVKIVVDESCANRTNFELGANHTHYHSINVNWGRDLPAPEQFYDIKVAKKGDAYPETGEVYEVLKTSEVGNIFNFGTDKSKQMDFSFTNEKGEKQFVHLGSYGIGITRVMGVIAEKFSDDKGLVWPAEVAPAQAYLIRLGDTPTVVKQADELYNRLTAAGVQVLYDDRSLRAGEKFADADLLGIPYRVIVSDKTVDDSYELKARQSDDIRHISFKELLKTLGTFGQALL
jgi:prolyl-tRNA synthetase